MRDLSLTETLANEHRDIDEGLARFGEGLRRGDFQTDALLLASRTLRRHIYLEEELLFPALRAAGLTAPLFVMMREHGEIWQALDELEKSGTQGADRDSASQFYVGLMEVLREHHRKEELVVYPAAVRLLEDSDNAAMRAFVQIGELPQGWICVRLRGSRGAGARDAAR